MTTITLSATASAVSPASVTLHYIVRSILLSFRQVGFVIFTLGLPVMLYLLFGALFGQTDPDARTYIMVSMAAYGAIGAALTAGAQIQLERRSGWFRQLMLTGLTPTGFLVGKIVTAMALILPGILLVFAVATIVDGVRVNVGLLALAAGAMWLGTVVMIELGLVLALWFKAETVNALNTIVLLGLSALGGLWLPVEQMPASMRPIAEALPTHWIGLLGRWAVLDDTFSPRGFLVLAAWALGLGILGLIGYRRAVKQSSR